MVPINQPIEANLKKSEVFVKIADVLTKPDVLDKVKKKSLPERIPGFPILLTILDVINFSLTTLSVKSLIDMPSIEILIFKYIFQLIPYALIALFKQYSLFGQAGHRLALFLRCIFGTISMILIYTAYRLVPLTDAASIYLSAPVLVTAFAFILFKEKLSRIQLITGEITLLAIFFIWRPDFIFGSYDGIQIFQDKTLGILLCIGAAITSAFSLLSLRNLETTPVPVVVMWYSFTVIVSSGSIVLFMDTWTVPCDVYAWLLLLALGVGGILNQYFRTIAFDNDIQDPIAVTFSFKILLSFIWEVAIFSGPEDWTSIFGAILISFCVVLRAMWK